MQLALWKWGKWYSSILQMPAEHRPDDETIADDRKLDLYMERLVREMERKAGKSKRKAAVSEGVEVPVYAGRQHDSSEGAPPDPTG